MGGGDLNMKKSWHPLTMQNLERVWKAEQKHEAEQKRIAELQQEIKEERNREEMKQYAVDTGLSKASGERVDWLYRGPMATNKEEYLLGKKIDKTVDPTLIEEEREKEALASGPGALFAGSEVNSATDLEMKIREDPLFLMKKREEEAKKKLLNNPVKMKQLQELLSKETDKKKRKSSRKHKSRYHDSDSESEDDIKRKGDPIPVSRGRERSPIRSRGPGHSKYSVRGSGGERKGGATSVSRKMDPKELERRRKEMMSFAKSRDKERESRLRKHEAEVKNEEQLYGKDDQFLKKLRVQSITSSKSVEDRIHRHIHSVQRTKSSMNNFM